MKIDLICHKNGGTQKMVTQDDIGSLLEISFAINNIVLTV
jgi:hypothetical protein